MNLSDIIQTFNARYKVECYNRKAQEIDLQAGILVSMLSESISSIQKLFGVIRPSTTIALVAGTDKYNLKSETMEIKNVLIAETALYKRSNEWMQEQIACSGTPYCYTIINEKARPKIWLYPNPSSADTATVYIVPSFSFFNTEIGSSTNFLNSGTGEAGFKDEVVFPNQYDKLIILGMLLQMFRDLQPLYDKEVNLLKVKQFNGEKFDYDPTWGIDNRPYY